MDITFVEGNINAGFLSFADNYAESALNLNDLLIKNPISTFFIRVQGDSMREAKIESGDILVVDRSLKAEKGNIIVACLNGEFTVKRLEIKGKKPFLVAANPNYPPIEVREGSEFQVWGVVTYVIHCTR